MNEQDEKENHDVRRAVPDSNADSIGTDYQTRGPGEIRQGALW